MNFSDATLIEIAEADLSPSVGISSHGKYVMLKARSVHSFQAGSDSGYSKFEGVQHSEYAKSKQ